MEVSAQLMKAQMEKENQTSVLNLSLNSTRPNTTTNIGPKKKTLPSSKSTSRLHSNSGNNTAATTIANIFNDKKSCSSNSKVLAESTHSTLNSA